MLTREQMQDNIIAKYGFESEQALFFCHLCEFRDNEWNNMIIRLEYDLLMSGYAEVPKYD